MAYAAFVALGMVNSLAGVAWPSIRDTFALPLGAPGVYLMANTIAYMLASALSDRLLAALNTGALLAGCCALVGLSGGALDGGMNAYAAAHFSPRSMNWMHACFGIGATLGPAVMTAAVTGGLGWRIGYALGPFLFVSALGMAALFELLLCRLPRTTDGSRGRL